MAVTGGVKSFTMRTVVFAQYQHWTDGRTEIRYHLRVITHYVDNKNLCCCPVLQAANVPPVSTQNTLKRNLR